MKYGTCTLFVSCFFVLIAIYHFCPPSWSSHNNKNTIQAGLESIQKKRKVPHFFHSRSVSANTEFDYFGAIAAPVAAAADANGRNIRTSETNENNNRVASYSTFDKHLQNNNADLNNATQQQRFSGYVMSSSVDNLSRGSLNRMSLKTGDRRNNVTEVWYFCFSSLLYVISFQGNWTVLSVGYLGFWKLFCSFSIAIKKIIN